MGNIDITLACAEHAPKLAALGAQTFCQSYGSALDPKELKAYVDEAFSVRQIEKELADPNIHYCVASIADTICAYAKLAPSPGPESLKESNAIELTRLYVTSEYWGQGIGSRLMSKVIDVADTCGYQHMWLRVWQENHRAIDFYRQWEFTTVGKEPYYVGACSETVLIMVKALQSYV